MTDSLFGKKLKSMMLSTSLVVFMGYVLMLTDDILIASYINDTALGGVNLIAPLHSFVLFISALITNGVCSCVIYEMARFKRDRVNMYFTIGLSASILSGIVLFALSFWGRDIFFSMFENSRALEYAKEYYSFYPFFALSYPVFTYLQQMCCTDGNEKLYMGSFFAQIGGNLVLSILLLQRIGIAGISLGTALGPLLGIFILLPHFLKKDKRYRLSFIRNRSDVQLVGKGGLVAASPLFFSAVFNYIFNSYFAAVQGTEWLPTLAVASDMLELTVAFAGIGLACAPIFAMYEGEHNNAQLGSVVDYAKKIAIRYGLVFSAIIIVFSNQVVGIFSIEDPALLYEARLAVILIPIGYAVASYMSLVFSFHTSAGDLGCAFRLSLVQNLIVPLVSFIPLLRLFGLHGLWTAMLLVPFISYLFLAIQIWHRYGRGSSLFLFSCKNSDIFFRQFLLTEESIIEMTREVDEFLVNRSICDGTRLHCSLLIEEIFMLVLEKNGGKPLRAECTVKVYDDVLLVLKDEGLIFDVTDSDVAVNNLRIYTLANLMIHLPRRVNYSTLLINRNAFKLPREEGFIKQLSSNTH